LRSGSSSSSSSRGVRGDHRLVNAGAGGRRTSKPRGGMAGQTWHSTGTYDLIYSDHITCTKRRHAAFLRTSHCGKKLDAGQSRTLARPAAPLATGVTKISSVDKTNKNGRGNIA